jgi:hypothetical protein
MSSQKINIRNSVLIIMIIAAAAMRLLNVNHVAVWGNFTPVGAVALFGGAYFSDKVKAYIIPLITLFISDLVIDYTFYHTFFYGGMIWVYAAFALMVGIGTLIKNVNVANVFLASIAAVAVHWLITDISPWLNGTLYAKNLFGYAQSLIAALPFEKNMLLGNLVYSALLFGGFELAKRRYTVLQSNKQLAV